MENHKLLFEKNVTQTNIKNIILKNGKAIFKNKDKVFNGASVDKLLTFINTLKSKYPKVKIPIILDLGNIQFADKLTIIFLEILCYNLIVSEGHFVNIYIDCENQIGTEGISSSPLLLLDKEEKNRMLKFEKKFSNDLFGRHYRKILAKSSEGVELSRRMDEIYSFFKIAGVHEDYIDEISEVIIELIGNAWEHSDTECLIDLDVTSPYFEEKKSGEFFGINIAVINFSEKLLGTSIKHRILESDDIMPERYKVVLQAYNNHKEKFNEGYKEEDFFNFVTLQDKISGRKEKTLTGGTGLTKLISSLEKRAIEHKCYLITGKRAIYFHRQYLDYNELGWLGFNDTNDFINEIPSLGVFGENGIYMPGTAYNLTFIVERG